METHGTVHPIEMRSLHEPNASDGDAFMTKVLVQVNQQWLTIYTQYVNQPKYPDHFIARKSLWLNDYFQKQRVVTDPSSRHAAELVQQFEKTIEEPRRTSCTHTGSPYSKEMIEPLSLMMYGAAQDRCSEFRVESFLEEVLMYICYRPILTRVVESGLSTYLYRLLVRHSKCSTRIIILTILLKLADENATSVEKGCEIGAQGQAMLPNGFIRTLTKRHPGSTELHGLVTRLLEIFQAKKNSFSLNLTYREPSSQLLTSRRCSSLEKPSMEPPADPVPLHSPITSRIHLGQLREKSPFLSQPKEHFGLRRQNLQPTMRKKWKEWNDERRKQDETLDLVDNPFKSIETTPRNSVQLAPLELIEQKLSSCNPPPPKNEDVVQKKKIEIIMPLIHHEEPKRPEYVRPVSRSTSHQSSRDLTSVKGFEWWWRTLPETHSALTNHGKLKSVCKAALKMHNSAIYDRAMELYELALSIPLPANVVVLPQEEDDTATQGSLTLKLHLNLGSAAFCHGHVKRSIRAFEAATKLVPENRWAHYKLGIAYKAAGRVNEAISEWKSVAAIFPPAQQALNESTPSISSAHERPKTTKQDHPTTPPMSGSTKQRVKDVLKHLAHLGAHYDINWGQLFGMVDRYHLGVVTVVAFKEIFQVSGLELTVHEHIDLTRFLRDPNDSRYISYSKLLADPTFVASSHNRAHVRLDQHCFQGTRKRTTMEKLRVPLHLIAQTECLEFFTTLATWARFGVDKSIGIPVLHSSWLGHLLQVPACPPSVVSTEATTLVRNAIASGALQAKHQIIIRRQVTHKMANDSILKVEQMACVHMARWREDGIHNVSVTMGGHVLTCGIAKALLTRRAIACRAHIQNQHYILHEWQTPVAHSRHVIDKRLNASMYMKQFAILGHEWVAVHRTNASLLHLVISRARRTIERRKESMKGLEKISLEVRECLKSRAAAMLFLLERVNYAYEQLEQSRITSLAQLKQTAIVVVAHSVVTTIMHTMVIDVAARYSGTKYQNAPEDLLTGRINVESMIPYALKAIEPTESFEHVTTNPISTSSESILPLIQPSSILERQGLMQSVESGENLTSRQEYYKLGVLNSTPR